MKKKIFSLTLCFLLFIIQPITIYADMGPKPSVVIDFEGFQGETYYVTLLSETTNSGPFSIDNTNYTDQDNLPAIDNLDPWQRFSSYKDKDGYYFLNYLDDCSETSQFVWGYYPPPRFKILLYFPKYDKFIVSEDIYERYAFDSYFYVDGNNIDIQSISSTKNTLKAVKNYNYVFELNALFVRIIATIIIEILVALYFGLRSKKQLLIITLVNIFTQTILNILLNILIYYEGPSAYIFNYVVIEILVILIEAVIYSIFLSKNKKLNIVSKRSAFLYVLIAPLYAISANVVSFLIGLYIASILPGSF